MVFHGPPATVSGVHVAVILLPALKTSPGLGSEGVGSAKAANARDKMKAGKRRENIEAAFSTKQMMQRGGKNNLCQGKRQTGVRE